MNNTIFIDHGFYSEPNEDHECYEMIWSNGFACKKCDHNCYRKGWDRRQVRADNKKIVTNKLQTIKNETKKIGNKTKKSGLKH